MKRLLIALLLAVCASPLAAQDSGTYANMGTCTAGNPRMYFVVDAVTTGSCAAGGGTGESQCCCLGGSWANCAAAGSGAPTTADYLVKTADGGLSAERVVTDTSTITWDWATGGQAKANVASVFLPASSPPAIDAAGGVWGESGVLAFEGNVADASETRIIVEEPTADRYFQIPNLTGYAQLSDCATCYGTAANSVMTTTNGILFEGTTANAFETTLLAGDPTADRSITLPDETGTVVTSASTNYSQYDPNRPPSSVGTGGFNEEWTGDTASVSWTWMNQDAATETISYDSSLITGEATAEENRGRYAAAATNADQTLTAKLIGVPFPTLATNSACFIGEISAGTVASPTALEFVGFGDFGTDNIGFYGDTDINPAAGVTVHGPTYTTWTIIYFYVAPIYLQLRYIDSTRALSAWSSWDGISWFQIGASATIAADPLFWGFGARDTAICRFYWVHLRTGSNLNDAGE